MTPRLKPLFKTIAAALFAMPAVSLDAQTTAAGRVRWSVIRIAGSPIGWSRVADTATASGIRAHTTVYLALNRMGSQTVLETNVTSTESDAGHLREIEVRTKMSDQATSTRVVVGGDRATITSRAGERSFNRSLDMDGDLLGAEGVRRLTASTLRNVGDSIRYQEWDAQVNAVATVTRRLLEIAPVQRGGATVNARKIVDRSTTTPMTITSWLDANGEIFRSAYMLPFGLTETIETDSAEALLAGSGGSLPEEQYGRTLVRTAVKLPRAREIESLRLTLRPTDSSLVIPDITGPGQRIVSRSPSAVVVDLVRRRPNRSGASFPVAASAAIREYLEPNAYIQSDDPELTVLARQVVGDERDLLDASLKLQQWVSENMTFDLGVVFAPSVEVFKRRRGTCVAYATILATLTRAVGIPSRIAMGYVYVNGIFGGHAWPEVLVGDEWIALDAAIVADGPADAARFAFAWSSLAMGPGPLTAGPGAALYGRLAATVESYSVPKSSGSRTISRTVGVGAKPYAVTGDRYQNPWMGIELTKPSTFRFADLDATWPAMTLVALEGPAKERVRIQSRLRTPWTTSAAHARAELERVVTSGEVRSVTVAGRAGWLRENGTRAALALPIGPETWVIDVEASDAGALLGRVSSTLRLRP